MGQVIPGSADGVTISMSATFEEDLEVDSLGVVELLMALEDNFDVKIPDEEAEKLQSVGDVITYINNAKG